MAKYIGKRIVPTHCGRWDRSRSYEMLSIVLEEASGDSYISRRDVPAGTAITDTHYWMLHSLYSQQIKDMSDQLSETERRIKADNDETEAAIRADNDETEQAIKADNAATARAINSRVDTAESAMTAQKSSFDAAEKQLNARMDTVLAAGTGAGDTEIVDARVDSEGNTHGSLGAAIRKVDAEVVGARNGLGGLPYPSLGAAMDSFSSPFLLRRRMPLANSVVTLTGTDGKTIESKEDIRGADGIVRACRFTAEIAMDYDNSSIMTHSYVTIEDFNTHLYGKKLIIQLQSPFSGVVNFSLGSQSCDGSGSIDDPAGSPPGSDGGLTYSTISYNMTVHEGYNELELDLSESLPQVRILKDAVDAGTWGMVCLSMIPFLWKSATFLPETGKTYDFYLAVCCQAEEPGMDVEEYFRIPQPAIARVAKAAASAAHADKADKAAVAEIAGHATHAETSGMAGISPLGSEPYSTHAGLGVEMVGAKARVTFGKDCYQTTAEGFSFRIGRVSDLRGKSLILERTEDVRFPFESLSINFGYRYGNYCYVSAPSSVTHASGNFYRLEFDGFISRAEAAGISFTDGTWCWLMIYGNSGWDLSVLGDDEQVTNSYRLCEEYEDALIFSRDIESLTNTVAALTEKLSAAEGTIARLEAGNVLWGKKWFATGDSFTSGGSVEDDKYFTDEPYKGKIKTYPLFIGRRNNMEVTNDAISGSVMAVTKQHLADPDNVDIGYRSPFAYKRYLAIPEDVDYITLWFGINDAGSTNLGTIDDETNETFYGAWNIVMRWILTNRPYAHVGIIITNGSSQGYRDAERQIAEKWGVPYLDMMGDGQVPTMTLGKESGLCTEAYNLRRSSYGVGHSPTGDSHPCWQAHEYESTFIEAFLRRL